MEAVAVSRSVGSSRMPAAVLRAASDERLVAQVRQGDEAAFEVIFDRHHRALLSFCRHMLGGQHEAEDAVQQTFLSAYRSLLSTDAEIQLRPWLYAIARNRCLTMLRSRREQSTGDIDAASTDVGGLSQLVEQREDLRELVDDLRHLPDDQRAALLLFELEDLSHEQIADVLQCRRAKVKALVFQARTSLAGSRDARAIPCADIREQLATAQGAALRRMPLRRHLAACEGCRDFRAETQRQKSAMAVLLPVVPTVALKTGALPWLAGGGAGAAAVATGGGAALGGGTAGGLAASGTAATAASSTAVSASALGGLGLAKVLAVGVLAAGTAGGIAVVDGSRDGGAPAPQSVLTSRPAASAPVAGTGLRPVTLLGSVTAAPAAATGNGHAARPGSGTQAGGRTTAPGQAHRANGTAKGTTGRGNAKAAPSTGASGPSAAHGGNAHANPTKAKQTGAGAAHRATPAPGTGRSGAKGNANANPGNQGNGSAGTPAVKAPQATRPDPAGRPAAPDTAAPGRSGTHGAPASG